MQQSGPGETNQPSAQRHSALFHRGLLRFGVVKPRFWKPPTASPRIPLSASIRRAARVAIALKNCDEQHVKPTISSA